MCVCVCFVFFCGLVWFCFLGGGPNTRLNFSRALKEDFWGGGGAVDMSESAADR